MIAYCIRDELWNEFYTTINGTWIWKRRYDAERHVRKEEVYLESPRFRVVEVKVIPADAD